MSEAIICNGRGDGGSHCCYLEGEVCKYLIYQGDTPRCGLRVEHGSWDAVHNDPRYLKDVKPVWIRTGTQDCGDWGINPPRCCFAK